MNSNKVTFFVTVSSYCFIAQCGFRIEKKSFCKSSCLRNIFIVLKKIPIIEALQTVEFHQMTHIKQKICYTRKRTMICEDDKPLPDN